MPIEIDRILKPDLFIAIVAPIGIDIDRITSTLETIFSNFNYETKHIKVTDYFKSIHIDNISICETPLSKRYDSYIKFGNAIRNKTDDDSILAALAVEEIARHREDRRSSPNKKPHVYIVRQFKRPEESDLFRLIYGKFFFQLSIFSSKAKRRELLTSKLASSSHRSEDSSFHSAADKLIETDENEIESTNGQRISDAFHHADFIVNSDIKQPVGDQLNRFINLIFGDNKISPTPREYGMYAAKASALRSLDLSRQVGAAIFTQDHEIISMGCNEVPKGLGGTYWPEPAVEDARDYTNGEDPNDKKKKINIADFLHRLKEAGYINDQTINIDQILKDKIIKDSNVMDALEFGRIVHAEMSALSDAARLGRATKDSILYCTTFPCHMCAKHIVASGIREVVYLEPYPKSAAFELHKDAIIIDGEESRQYRDNKKAIFNHFFGVTPRRYRDFFEKGKRKKDGIFLEWKNEIPSPIYDMIIDLPLILETVVINGPLKDLKDKHSKLFKI